MNCKLLLSIAALVGAVAAAGYGPYGAPMCDGCTITGTGGDQSLWGWENNTACEIDTSKCGGNSSATSGTKTLPNNNTNNYNNNNNNSYTSNTKTLPNSNTGNIVSTGNNTGSSYTPKPIGNAGKRAGKTTRYWDCCKPSCSWNGKASVSHPVNTCSRDGSLISDVDARSGCDGGEAFMCTDQQPWAVSDTLSYGFAAASISGGSESTWCCACYKLTFTSTSIAGKEMIVQVTNTGGDLGENHFDLQMPGGGLGIFDGCSTQFNTNAASWGERYGGLRSVDGCANLPASLQKGCEWRFGWFENADNPSMEFEEVECPVELTEKTGCVRL